MGGIGSIFEIFGNKIGSLDTEIAMYQSIFYPNPDNSAMSVIKFICH
jgi:hypothetical protein